MTESIASAGARRAIESIIAGETLSTSETESLFGTLMDGGLFEKLKAALLAGLAARGVSVDESAGAARALRSRVVKIPTDLPALVDTCGTGGDGKGTFNISTAAALVAASAGASVAKHGNRSVSSRSGSADVLEALGVDLQISPKGAARALEEIGIAFLFARNLHPAMREAAAVRSELGFRTIFNILGPLTNPAGARRQVVGVYEDRLVPVVAEVLVELGCDHALVVRGADGLDELPTTSETLIAEVWEDRVETYVVTPEQFRLRRAGEGELAGGDPAENARMMRAVLAGAPGPIADATALNAGAALYVSGLTGSLSEGVDRAGAVLKSGAGAEKLEELRTFVDSGE